MHLRMRKEEGVIAKPLSATLAVLLAALALLWPAVVNGRPPVFADTAYYFSLGEYASELSGLVQPASARVASSDPTRLAHDGLGRPALAYTLMGARAPTYALYLYWTQRIGGLWLTVWLQALGVAWTLWLLARGFAPGRPLVAFSAATVVAAALTPLPFYAGFAMPDVFGGVAAAGALALLAFWERFGRGERAGLIALLLFAMTVHGSHPLTAAAFGIAGAGLIWLLRAGPWTAAVRGVALMVLAVAGVALDAAGFALLDKAGGEPLSRPPFLTARLLADGPGRLYLRRACAADRQAFVICPDANKRLVNSEHILWRDEPWLGVFSPAPFERRLAISADDGRFARAVVLHDPIGVGVGALNNWRMQLERGFVDDPLTNQGFWMRHPYWRRTSLAAISVDPRPCLARLGCPSKIPLKPLKILHLWVEGLAAGWLTLRLVVEVAGRDRARQRPLWSEDRTRLFAAVALALGVVLINAAVCGMISGPFPRYQARVVWLLPAVAALLEVGLWRRRSRGAPKLDSSPP